jgi:molybdopterin-guanine dinucleotide biosynthesis protein
MATTTMMTMTTTTTTTTTMASNNNEAIRTVLATFNRESQRAKEYVAPQDQVLCEGYKRAMNEKFASVIKEMKTTGETKSLDVIERDYINHSSEEFREANLTSCVSERLFIKKDQRRYNICPCDCFVP